MNGLNGRKYRRPGAGRGIALAVAAGAVAFAAFTASQAWAQHVVRKQNEKREQSFTRPAPTRPVRPEVPGANRFRDDKIFLEYADSLFKTASADTVERQVVKGQVKFRQAGMWMFCDSAYYYPQLNSLDAFGHVRMEQGDTLFVYADKLFYDGNDKFARLNNGISCPKVKLVNKDVTLTTDSLDYDLRMELGWYSRWGTIDDKVNTLTSLYGEYSPGTKKADFFNDVVLVNNDDGYTVLTDTLHYNTDTHIALFESPTEIQGATDTIVTTKGVYDTDLGNAVLLARSMLIHRDSNNNVTTLEGDSIIYNKLTSVSEAFMFRSPAKNGLPMVLTDTARSTTLIGGYGRYNDRTREALATDYPLLMEYSQGDTLFLRADTIKTYVITEMVRSTGLTTPSGFPEWNGKVIARMAGGGLWLDEGFFDVEAPLARKPLRLLALAAPAAAKPAPRAVTSEKLVIPQPRDPHGEMAGYLPDAEMHAETADSCSAPLAPKDFHVALAYHRARFFKQDLQGVADSMVVVERDSMLYMFRKPVVWSGERQVAGNRIDVHFNDSTADWALLPESGLMAEHVGEDFYNQLAGKKMFATFADQTLRTLEVSGNVETVFLPQESDSTYNRMVTAESSYLTIALDSGKMEKMKMWPEVSGTVTPLFLVKKSQQYLPQFRWFGAIRPEREWYAGRWHWNDNLGEVTDDLELYFNTPSSFGEPESFPAMRPATATTATGPEKEEPAEVLDPEGATLQEVEENETQMETEEKEITGKLEKEQ